MLGVEFLLACRPDEMRIELADPAVLIERLVESRNQPTIFLVGSALVAPENAGQPGIPWANDIVTSIRKIFEPNANSLARFEEKLAKAGTNKYQAAFSYLLSARGADDANCIIREAVLKARNRPSRISPKNVEKLRSLENDENWHLPPGVTALGALVARFPDRFGKTVLTTNFDPILKISVRKAGGRFSQTALQTDGSLSQNHSDGCNIVQLHGDWLRSDTLHSESQLTHERRHLKASIIQLVRNSTLVVVGYGGWDDVLTSALFDIVSDADAQFNILWSFYGTDRAKIEEECRHLLDKLAPGVSRGRVCFYGGVDVNRFFPDLLAGLDGDDSAMAGPTERIQSGHQKRQTRSSKNSAKAQTTVTPGTRTRSSSKVVQASTTQRPSATEQVRALPSNSDAAGQSSKPKNSKNPSKAPGKRKGKLAVAELRSSVNAEEMSSKSQSHEIASSKSAQIRNKLESVLGPWPVQLWSERDNSDECIVEISRPSMNNATAELTGRRFMVRIASISSRTPTDATVCLDSATLQRLFRSTEPVLVTPYDDSTNRFLYRWVDTKLQREIEAIQPTWQMAQHVEFAIPISRYLDSDSLADLDREIALRKGSNGQLLEPGAFFQYQNRAMRAVDQLSQLATQHDVQSVQGRLRRLHEILKDATYIIAVAGPSRAGKSTLLNALVGRQLSPVGVEPTTAVWIVVMAGAVDGATVFLQNGDTIEGTADATFLGQYASQNLNEDNVKQVMHILVRLRSPELERGIAFVDAPGLRDPSPEIQAVTDRALKSAHAIIYTLDVSTAADGGFHIDKPTLDEIRTLGSVTDRMFLVLNKSDKLKIEDKTRTLMHVEKTLTKFGVKSHFSHDPIFISAKAAWQYRQNPSGSLSPLHELETMLWKYLLESNSTGMERLRVAVTELERATQDFATLFSDELRATLTVKKLENAIERCHASRKEIIDECERRRDEDISLLETELSQFKVSYLQMLNVRLTAIPINHDLPTEEDLLAELRTKTPAEIFGLWNQLVSRAGTFSTEVGAKIEAALAQVRLVVAAPAVADAPRIPAPSLVLNNSEISPQVAQWGLLGGMIGVAFGPIGFLIGSILGAFGGWLAGREEHRKKQIQRNVDKVGEAIDKMLVYSKRAMGHKLEQFHSQLRAQVRDRIDVFLHDIERRRARSEAILSDDEKQEMAAARNEIEKISADVVTLAEELRGFDARGAVR